MKDIKEYIDSGQLELFVFGVLPEDEMKQVAEDVQAHTALQEEVLRIEKSVLQLSSSVSKGVKPSHFVDLYISLKDKEKEKNVPAKTNWTLVSSWAAVFLAVVGLVWAFQQNNTLSSQLATTENEKQNIENKLVETQLDLQTQEEILAFIRNNPVQVIDLPANEAVIQSAFAKVYYDASSQVAYMDLQGLPDPPEGMVYQVWSLLMQPLTPTSIGVIDEFSTNENKLFQLKGIPTSEAFGITLEPSGGSETPTLSNLYVLGTV